MKNLVTALSALIAVACFVLSVWGSARFPYAPIKKTDSGYLDKFGHVETAEEYQAFLLLHRTRSTLAGALAIFAVSSVILHYRTLRVAQKPNQSITDNDRAAPGRV